MLYSTQLGSTRAHPLKRREHVLQLQLGLANGGLGVLAGKDGCHILKGLKRGGGEEYATEAFCRLCKA